LEVAHVVGHGVTGGAANVAMGGKFQDGFLSAAAGAAATHTGIYGKFKGAGAINAAGRTAVAGIIGGTASALAAGKFANGAWTAAFQHLLNNEAQGWCVDCRAGDTYGSGSAGNLLDTTRALGEEFPFLANAERFVNDLVGDILYSCPPEALGANPGILLKGPAAAKTLASSLNPNSIRYMQSSIKNQTGQYTVLGNAQALKSGTLLASDLPAIKVWADSNGRIWTLDHRRLAAFKLAEINKVPLQWASDKEVMQHMWKMTTKTDGTSIRLKLGDGSSQIIK
jgi:hypothetical protein